MFRVFISSFFFCISMFTWAQSNLVNVNSIPQNKNAANVFVQALYSDSANVSSFLIQIRKEVKKHKHLSHAEHVLVVEGEGKMTLGDSTFNIKKGDLIFIPRNTFHSVITTSVEALKVLSIQAPFFDGTDRVFSE